MRQLIERLRARAAAQFGLADCRERLLSAAGGFIGIVAVMVVSGAVLDEQGAAWMVASMGATSVLLFAVPHGQLSQPWPVFGGQILSALVGVACAQWIGPPVVAAAAAVSGSILVMYHLRCLHPPGGATALVAVVGGEPVRALGYAFVVTPVLINVVILLAVAVAMNWPFAWRRYPLSLAGRGLATPDPLHALQVERGDLEWALRQINSFIDVSQRDLARILELALRHAREREAPSGELVVGGCYSNGRFGDEWQVRKLVHAEPDAERPVRYLVVAGARRGARGTCSRDEFARWARHRVVRTENSWHRREQGIGA